MVEMEVNKEDLTRFFMQIDEDGSGLIDKSEIAMFLINMKRTNEPTKKEKDMIALEIE